MAGFELDRLETASRAEQTQTSEQLKAVRESLIGDMQDAVLDGDGAKMISLDSQIKSLNARIFAAEVSEIKKTIEDMEARREELAEELLLLNKLKAGFNERLEAALIKAQEIQAEFNRVEFSYQFAQNERRNLGAGITNYKRRLEDLKQSKLQEMNRNYE